jgi:hypothetical protein
MENWKIYIIIATVIGIVTLIVVLSSKKKSSNNTQCVPDRNSCIDWVNNGAQDAYLPCPEGIVGKCTGNEDCGQGGFCSSDGCCVFCKSPSNAINNQDKKCIEQQQTCTPIIPGESTTYTCECDSTTPASAFKCNNFNLYYSNSENPNQKEQNPTIANLLCSNPTGIIKGDTKLPYPTGWQNVPNNGISASLSRTCLTTGQLDSESQYTNFTCPSGTNPDPQNNKCSGSVVPCTNDPYKLSCAGVPSNTFPQFSCDPSMSLYNGYCGGETDSNGNPITDCLTPTTPGSPTGPYYGRHECINGQVGTPCYPCCNSENGWYFDKTSTRCERIPMGYTVGYENKNGNPTDGDQVLVRMPPTTNESVTLWNWCNDNTPRGDWVNANLPPSNLNRNAGYVLNCDDSYSVISTLKIPKDAYYTPDFVNWKKCEPQDGSFCTDGTSYDYKSTSGYNTGDLNNSSLKNMVSIQPQDITPMVAASDPGYTDPLDSLIVCKNYSSETCPVWCDKSSGSCEFRNDPNNTECQNVIAPRIQVGDDLKGYTCPHPYCGIVDNTGINCLPVSNKTYSGINQTFLNGKSCVDNGSIPNPYYKNNPFCAGYALQDSAGFNFLID